MTTARARHRFQVRRHIDVVLDGVQVGPGQVYCAGAQVPVFRLVHVPHNTTLMGCSAGIVQPLSQHFRGYQHHAPVGDVEAPCILFRVDADLGVRWNNAAFVDDSFLITQRRPMSTSGKMTESSILE